MPMQAKRVALPIIHLGSGDWVGWNGSNRSLSGAPVAVTGDCVTPEGVRGGWVGPRGSNRILMDLTVSYRGTLASVAVTGGWVKRSGINSTLYEPQSFIGSCFGPLKQQRVLCDHRGSNRKLCGLHRQKMDILGIPVAVIQVWVGPFGSDRMLCGPRAVTGSSKNAVKRSKMIST